MDDTERKERAKQLREEQQIVRSSTSTIERNRSPVQGRRSPDAPIGSNSEDIGGYTKESSEDTGDARSTYRGTQERVKRRGQDGRRPEYDSSSLTERSGEIRRTGLSRADSGEHFDPAIEHQKIRKDGQIKEQAGNIWKGISGALSTKKGSVLTKKEAEEYYEPLKAAILDTGTSMDQLIEWRIQHPLPREIWGNISDFEAESLAKIMIKRGQESPYAAAVVRRFVHMKDYITVGLMTLPRIQMTVETLRLAEQEKHETTN